MLDLGGLRIVVDPTFDAPGPHGYLTKTAGPALEEAGFGPVDVVLVSHSAHPDNLADARAGIRRRRPAGAHVPVRGGRAGTSGARTPALGLPLRGRRRRDHGGARRPWLAGRAAGRGRQRQLRGHRLPRLRRRRPDHLRQRRQRLDPGRRRGGPEDSAHRCRRPLAGAARVREKFEGRPLTLDAVRAAAAAAILGSPIVVPAHYDGWAHFSETDADIAGAFEQAGYSSVLRLPDHGTWIRLDGSSPSGS